MSPNIIFGEKSYLQIYDNLDGPFVDYLLLARSNKIFSGLDSVLPQIANGLTRNVFPSEFDFTLWLFYLFPPLSAYFINIFILRILAFFGMFLLLKNHILDKKISPLIIYFVSLIFALLPFLFFGSGSVTLLPLTFFIFLNIRKNKHSWYNWVILGLIPLFTSLPIVYLFFIISLVILWMVDLVIYKKINPVFIFTILIFFLFFLIKEYRLVYVTFFDSRYISHRIEFVEARDSFLQALQKTLVILRYGQYHFQSAAFPVLISSWFLALILRKKKKFPFEFYWTTIIILLLAIGYGFSDVWFWKDINSKILLLRTFNTSRFFILMPLFWYINWAYSLQFIWQSGKYGRKLAFFLISIQLIFIFYKNENIQGTLTYKINFQQFFAKELFDQIKSDIDSDASSYRVVSLGIHPSIASYNGFYTLDFYLNNYPLSYKYEFRQIIAEELDKSIKLKQYYDQWGNRCYLFLTELPVQLWPKSDYQNIKIFNPRINTIKLKAMGGKYIFSAAKIAYPEKMNLKLFNRYSDNHSAWDIYVYELI